MESMLSERGAPLRILEGFKFRRSSTLRVGERWRCTNKKCSAYFILSEEAVLERSTGHNHPLPKNIKREAISNIVKRKALEDISSRPVKLLRRELMARDDGDLTETDLVRMRKNISHIRRHHSKVRPPSPRSTDEVQEAVGTVPVSQGENLSLEEDVVNIMKYRLGYTRRLELRPGVVPHRCLEGDKNQPPAKKNQETLLDQAEESITVDEMPIVKDEPIWLTEDGPRGADVSLDQPPLLSDREDDADRSRKRKTYEDLSDQDPFDVFGKHVANKLRTFSREQNALAQRLISEVLFEGEMGGLNRRVRLNGCSGWRGSEAEHIGEFVAVQEEELGLQPE